MLNGKFYAGLPPKMMERNAGAQNRLESHLFWPDDSKTESATESRLKRRTSFQANTPRDTPRDIQRQTSWCGEENGVDTRQRFRKEFANSSIQFCDNIQEEEMDSGRQHAMRKPLIRKTLKQDIAIKPTAMNMKLPNNDTTQEEYAAIKKNQAFSSKIRFYDYADNNESRNNKQRPKMDMNDKKDVERNMKNSPKLQVKGIVRNLRVVDEQRNNDRNQREHFSQERNYENYDDEERPRSETRIIRNEVRAEQRSNNSHLSGSGGRSDRYMRYESPVRSYRQHNEHNFNDDMSDMIDDMPQQYNERRAIPRAQSVPKRILKNPIRDERDYEERGGAYNDLEYVERGARDMRIRTSPKKHVTYGDEVYEYETHNGNYDNDEHTSYREQRSRPDESMENANTVRTATYSMKSTNRSTTGNNQRQHNRPNTLDFEANGKINDEERCTNDRMVGNNASKKSLSLNKSNNNNNNYNNNNHSSSSSTKNSTKLNNVSQRQQRNITPKISTSSMASTSNDSTTTAPTSPLSPTMDAQKHLRSSLCFSGGEIVANNQSTPTSESGSRRTARGAATTRRVCVGLPD